MTFTTLYRCKGICDGANSLTEMAEQLETAAKELREMEAAGVITLDGPVNDDYAELSTEDKEAADKFGLTELEDDIQDDEFQPAEDEEGQ